MNIPVCHLFIKYLASIFIFFNKNFKRTFSFKSVIFICLYNFSFYILLTTEFLKIKLRLCSKLSIKISKLKFVLKILISCQIKRRKSPNTYDISLHDCFVLVYHKKGVGLLITVHREPPVFKQNPA